MTAIFQDLQQADNIMNGICLTNAHDVVSLFRSLADRKPFLFELLNDNGFVLMIGFARNCASAQHSSNTGLPPYMMAVSCETENHSGECVEFLAGNTPTPIPQRFCLPIQAVEDIAKDFLESGSRSESLCWEEI